MRPEVVSLLFDARMACGHVRDFIRGHSFEKYRTDLVLRSAVERQLIIVGEALFQASKLDATLFDRISGMRRIVGFRHVMVHGYAKVQDGAVWTIVEEHVPVLQAELEALLIEGPMVARDGAARREPCSRAPKGPHGRPARPRSRP